MRAGLSNPLCMSALLAAQLISPPAYSQAQSCSDYFYNGDGSWSPTHPIMFVRPTSRGGIGPRMRFRAGMRGPAGRLPAISTLKCRNIVPNLERQTIPRMP
jgi:hypothetical protein